MNWRKKALNVSGMADVLQIRSSLSTRRNNVFLLFLTYVKSGNVNNLVIPEAVFFFFLIFLVNSGYGF